MDNQIVLLVVGGILVAGFVLLLAFYMVSSLRHDIRNVAKAVSNEVAKDVAVVQADYSVDTDTGRLLKGSLRNVSLRVTTVQKAFDALADELPPDKRSAALQSAGTLVGQRWGRDLLAEYARMGLDNRSLEERLAYWSNHDAEAGMGKLTFVIAQEGHGTVLLRNGFLTDTGADNVLDHFQAGYLRGALEQVLDMPLKVEVIDPRRDRHDEAAFHVSPRVEEAEAAWNIPRPGHD